MFTIYLQNSRLSTIFLEKRKFKMIKKIISGGQTGVDQAALDAVIELEIPYGGKCPKGRIDENGSIPDRFKNLEEINGEFKTEKDNYDARTKKNIEESDGTLIIAPSFPLPEKIKDGTLVTIKEVRKTNKPHLLIDLSKTRESNSLLIINWVKKYDIVCLNIAGPRESNAKGIHKACFDLLKATLFELKPKFSYCKL